MMTVMMIQNLGKTLFVKVIDHLTKGSGDRRNEAKRERERQKDFVFQKSDMGHT